MFLTKYFNIFKIWAIKLFCTYFKKWKKVITCSREAASVHIKALQHSLEYIFRLKLRIKHIITRHQNEILCVTHDETTGAEDVKWINKDDVKVEVMENQNDDANGGLYFSYIMSTSKWLTLTLALTLKWKFIKNSHNLANFYNRGIKKPKNFRK